MYNLHTVIIKPGYDKSAAIEIARTALVDEMTFSPNKFVINGVKSVIDELRNIESVFIVIENVNEPQDENCGAQRSRLFDYYRISAEKQRDTNESIDNSLIYSGQTSDGYNYGGKWFLKRHSSPTNDTVLDAIVQNNEYEYKYDGTGVDIIMNLGSCLDRTDPQFMTNGVTRLKEFQWNTLPGMGALATVDYDASTGPETEYYEKVTVSFNPFTDIVTSGGETGSQITGNISDYDWRINIPNHNFETGDKVQIHGDNDQYKRANGDHVLDPVSSTTKYEEGLRMWVSKVTVIDNNTITLRDLDETHFEIYDLTAANHPDVSEIKLSRYTTNFTSSSMAYKGVSDHGEPVAYFTAANDWGYATGADLYVWPRDQMEFFDRGGWRNIQNERSYGYDCWRLFHENKGNNRPTVVVSARGNSFPAISKYDKFYFRGELYDGTAGVGDYPVSGYRGDSRPSGPGTPSGFGFDSGRYFSTPDEFEPVIAANGAAFDIHDIGSVEWHSATARENGYFYAVGDTQRLENMIDAGVFFVTSAGNYSDPIQLDTHPDYNNGLLKTNNKTGKVLSFTAMHRPGYTISGDAIAVGALESGFEDNILDYLGQESLAEFSTRGSRVDCVAAGAGLMWRGYSNGRTTLQGTSFSGPIVGGFVACVLEKYPSTTPRQMRRYLRDHAVGSETLSDHSKYPIQSTRFGDPQFFRRDSCQGYSGNILYFDKDLSFDPTTLPNTPITWTGILRKNTLDFTIDEINNKLDSI